MAMRRTKFNTNIGTDDTEKHARQKRAIAGEYKLEDYPGILWAVTNDLLKLWREKRRLPERRVDEFPDYDETDKTDENQIVEAVRGWLTETTDERKKARLVSLDPHTKRWLRNRIPDWNYHIARAKRANPVSDTLKRKINSRLLELVREQVEGNIPFVQLYFGQCCFDDEGLPQLPQLPDDKELFKIFFREVRPYTDSDSRFGKIRHKALEDLREELVHVGKYLDALEPAKRRLPPKWMTQNKSIMENLERKGNKRFLALFEILKNSRMKFVEDGGPVLVRPNYDVIENKTGLPEPQTRFYLREMCRWKIVRKIGKPGSNQQAIYSLGVWIKGKARHPRPIYFLKNSPQMKEALENFDVSRK
jgi:hypothetical protein